MKRNFYGTESVEQFGLHGVGGIFYFRDIFAGGIFRSGLAARNYGGVVCHTYGRGIALSGAVPVDGRAFCQGSFCVVVDHDVSLFGYGFRAADDCLSLRWQGQIDLFFLFPQEIEPPFFLFVCASCAVQLDESKFRRGAGIAVGEKEYEIFLGIVGIDLMWDMFERGTE